MKSENEMHMHALTINFVDENHLKNEWTSHVDGKPSTTAAFELERDKS